MEEAAELANYLPLSFKTPKEQEYVEFLWDAFETNYTHGKYQFAFLAYHMLTMSFVYFNIWQIKQTEPVDTDVYPPAPVLGAPHGPGISRPGNWPPSPGSHNIAGLPRRTCLGKSLPSNTQTARGCVSRGLKYS